MDKHAPCRGMGFKNTTKAQNGFKIGKSGSKQMSSKWLQKD